MAEKAWGLNAGWNSNFLSLFSTCKTQWLAQLLAVCGLVLNHQVMLTIVGTYIGYQRDVDYQLFCGWGNIK